MADMKNIIDKKVEEWLTWDKNEETRKEIEKLAEEKNYEQLQKLLCNRMEFGTAGLRARMGAGYSQMNDLTIIQTAQGLGEYMLKVTPEVREKGVIIGWDARHNSRKFAKLTACVLLNKFIPVYLFTKICPTPFVAYGVIRKGCSWGVMITASHNPKEDNGFKVYYSNGAQIISPHDKGISQHIMENLEPHILSWTTKILSRSMILYDPYDDVREAYFREAKSLCFEIQKCPLTLTYTPMHGVGWDFMKEALALIGCDVVPVKQQMEPDPDFPTVKYPNPEEGKSALNLAIETANTHNSTLILANDPDADRLAVAEKQSSGEWHTFTGNELGTLLGWYLIRKYKENPANQASEAYCLASTVSSKMLKRMCEMEGLGYKETLTGFKYMGNVSCNLLANGKKVLFAFEEAIGYMCGTTVLDKDGISAGLVLAGLATYAHNHEGKNLKELLLQLYQTYGYHTSKDSYYLCFDKEKITRIFDRIRCMGSGQYPRKIGRYEVKAIRDLHTGYDDGQKDKKAIFPVSASSEMMTFTFVDPPVIMTLRTSGTEPKIKYYSEYCSGPDSQCKREEMRDELEKLVSGVLEELLQPKLNQLQSKEA